MQYPLNRITYLVKITILISGLDCKKINKHKDGTFLKIKRAISVKIWKLITSFFTSIIGSRTDKQ